MQTLAELIYKYTKHLSEHKGFECDMGALLDAIHISGYEWFVSELKKSPLKGEVVRAAYMHIAHKSLATAYIASESEDSNIRKDVASIMKDVQYIPKLEVLDIEFPHLDFWKNNTFFNEIHLLDRTVNTGDLKIIEWFMEDLVDAFCTGRVNY